MGSRPRSFMAKTYGWAWRVVSCGEVEVARIPEGIEAFIVRSWDVRSSASTALSTRARLPPFASTSGSSLNFDMEGYLPEFTSLVGEGGSEPT